MKHLGHGLYYLGRYEEAAARVEEAARSGDRDGSLFAAYWQHLASRRGLSLSIPATGHYV